MKDAWDLENTNQLLFGKWAQKFQLKRSVQSESESTTQANSKANSMVNIPVEKKVKRRKKQVNAKKKKKKKKKGEANKKKYKSKGNEKNGEKRNAKEKRKSKSKLFKTGELGNLDKMNTQGRNSRSQKRGKEETKKGRKKKGGIKRKLEKSFLVESDKKKKPKKGTRKIGDSGQSGRNLRVEKYPNFTEVGAPRRKESSPLNSTLPVFLFSKKSKSYNASLIRNEISKNAFKKKTKKKTNLSNRMSPNVRKQLQKSRSPNLYRPQKKKFFSDFSDKLKSPKKKFRTNQLAKKKVPGKSATKVRTENSKKDQLKEAGRKVSLLNVLGQLTRSQKSEGKPDFINSQSNSALPQSAFAGVTSSCIEQIASRTSDGPLLPFHKPSRKLAKKTSSKFERGQSSPKRNLYAKHPKYSHREDNSKKMANRKASRSRSTRRNLRKNDSYLQKYHNKRTKEQPRNGRRGKQNRSRAKREKQPIKSLLKAKAPRTPKGAPGTVKSK